MKTPPIMCSLIAAASVVAGALMVRADPPSAPMPPTQMPPAPTIGYLQPLSCLTVLSNTPHYFGYYVGGGCNRLHRADPRLPTEGTWGWDYRGWLLPRWVQLGWWHGRRYQGGTGAYRTEGPHYHEHEEATEAGH